MTDTATTTHDHERHHPVHLREPGHRRHGLVRRRAGRRRDDPLHRRRRSHRPRRADASPAGRSCSRTSTRSSGSCRRRRSAALRGRCTSPCRTSTPSTAAPSTPARRWPASRSDEAYGARSFTMIDPFGHRWMIQTPIGNPGRGDPGPGRAATRSRRAGEPDVSVLARPNDARDGLSAALESVRVAPRGRLRRAARCRLEGGQLGGADALVAHRSVQEAGVHALADDGQPPRREGDVEVDRRTGRDRCGRRSASSSSAYVREPLAHRTGRWGAGPARPGRSSTRRGSRRRPADRRACRAPSRGRRRCGRPPGR